MNEPIRVCPLQTKELTGVSAGGLELVVVPTASGPRVFEGRCPHQGTLLSEGQLVDGVLVCRAHGWKFDATTGHRCDAAGPGLTPVPTITKDDGLYVDVATHEQKPKAQRTLADLPGPRGWPVIGNTLSVSVDRLHLHLEAWAEQFGPVYRVALPKKAMVVSDPALIEQALRARPAVFRRVSDLEPMSKELGTFGVFTAEGDSWRKQRRLATESLSHRHFERFFPTMSQATRRLKKRWVGAKGAPVDVLSDLTRLTVDVTTGLAFGLDMNTLEHEEVIQEHLSHIFPALGRRLLSPVKYWRYFKLPVDRRLDASVAEIQRVLGELIGNAHARVEQLPEGQRVAANFLEAMILARDDAGQPFSDDIIYGNTLTMLLAGEDTTASSTAWAIHEVCDRPDVLARARAEIAQVVDGDGVLPNLSAANALPWLDAIAYETLRVRPVAPFILLEANEDTVLGDLAVDRGTPVYVLFRLAGLRAPQFTEPAQFRPERWLENQHPHTGGGYTPFGGGPRLCPGRSLALLEMRTVLAMVLHGFDLTREGPADAVSEHWAFTAVPKGLRVRFTPRA